MPESLRLAANATKARLFDASRETKLMVSEFLSYQVEGAEQNQSFRAGHWDGRSSFFDFKTASFPAGFCPVLLRELRKRGHAVQFIQKEAPAPLGPELGLVDFLGYGWSDRYDYQPETVRRLLVHKRMTAQVATGGGKSAICVMATGTIRRPSIFLTTRAVLMHQMKATYEKAGFVPGVMGDGIWQPRKGANVAMVQTINARLAPDHPEREQTLKLLKYFEFVIGEEAHEAGGSSYFDILQAMEHAHYRLALTGTPFMRPDGEANMRLMAAFGPIGIQVSEALLIERGILARPNFKLISTSVPATLRRGTKWPTCYELGVVENPERNRSIVYEAHRAAAHGLPVMILIQRKKHGQILEAACQAAGLKVEFIFGEHDNGQRQAALGRLKNGLTQVLIGSTILDVGVDVPAVGMMILAGGGKAEVAHRQRIGRGLREKKTGPNECFIVDYVDDKNKTLQEHALTRRAILEATAGFRENILPEGGDFDYGKYRTVSNRAA